MNLSDMPISFFNKDIKGAKPMKIGDEFIVATFMGQIDVPFECLEIVGTGLRTMYLGRLA